MAFLMAFSPFFDGSKKAAQTAHERGARRRGRDTRFYWGFCVFLSIKKQNKNNVIFILILRRKYIIFIDMEKTIKTKSKKTPREIPIRLDLAAIKDMMAARDLSVTQLAMSAGLSPFSLATILHRRDAAYHQRRTVYAIARALRVDIAAISAPVVGVTDGGATRLRAPKQPKAAAI